MFTVLALIFAILGFACFVIILIDAFNDEIWKGLVGLFCGLYLLYYALFEFDHEKKWPIVAGWLLCGTIGGVLYRLG